MFEAQIHSLRSVISTSETGASITTLANLKFRDSSNRFQSGDRPVTWMARAVHSSPSLLSHDPGLLKLNYTLNSPMSHGRTLTTGSITSVLHLLHLLHIWTLDLLKSFVQWAPFFTVSAGTGLYIFPIHLDNEIEPALYY